MYVDIKTNKKICWERCQEFNKELRGAKPFFWRFAYSTGSSKWIVRFDPKSSLWELKNEMWKSMCSYCTPLLAMEIADDITAHELSSKKNYDCQ